MENNRILRSPDVSVDVVTLKSGYEGEEGKKTFSTESVGSDFSKENIDSDMPEIENEVLDEIDLQALSANLNEEKLKINSEKEELKSSYIFLEEKENSYKQEIYDKLKQEISEELKAKSNEKLEQLDQLINMLSNKAESDINGFEDEIVAIVYESVCKIIGMKMEQPETIVSVVKEVMKYSQDRMEMVLRVSSENFEILQGAREKLNAGVSNHFDIVADDHVRYGGCILETTAGRIDGRLEQQLSSLMQVLLNVRD